MVAEPSSQEKPDLSRTEALLDAFADALAARKRCQEIRDKHVRFDPAAYGELGLEAELAPAQATYFERLDRLRALLTNAGVTV